MIVSHTGLRESKRAGISRIILILGVVAVVIVGVVGAAVLLVGSMKPPVDISGTPQFASSTDPSGLLPTQLLSQTRQDVTDVSGSHDTSYRGDFSTFTVVVGKGADASAASSVIGDEYDYWTSTSGSHSSVRVGNWFTFDGSSSVIGWTNGIWFYIVSAEDSSTRNQVAQQLITYLNQIS